MDLSDDEIEIALRNNSATKSDENDADAAISISQAVPETPAKAGDDHKPDEMAPIGLESQVTDFEIGIQEHQPIITDEQSKEESKERATNATSEEDAVSDIFKGLAFWIPCFPGRSQYVARIVRHGGQVVADYLNQPKNVWIVVPRGNAMIISSAHMHVFTDFITECADNRTLLDVEKYRVPDLSSAAKASAGVKSTSAVGRSKYSKDEDRKLVQAVWRLEKKYNDKIRGNALYQEIEKDFPGRSFHSLRDRYLKHLLHRVDEYGLGYYGVDTSVPQPTYPVHAPQPSSPEIFSQQERQPSLNEEPKQHEQDMVIVIDNPETLQQLEERQWTEQEDKALLSRVGIFGKGVVKSLRDFSSVTRCRIKTHLPTRTFDEIEDRFQFLRQQNRYPGEQSSSQDLKNLVGTHAPTMQSQQFQQEMDDEDREVVADLTQRAIKKRPVRRVSEFPLVARLETSPDSRQVEQRRPLSELGFVDELARKRMDIGSPEIDLTMPAVEAPMVAEEEEEDEPPKKQTKKRLQPMIAVEIAADTMRKKNKRTKYELFDDENSGELDEELVHYLLEQTRLSPDFERRIQIMAETTGFDRAIVLNYLMMASGNWKLTYDFLSAPDNQHRALLRSYLFTKRDDSILYRFMDKVEDIDYGRDYSDLVRVPKSQFDRQYYTVADMKRVRGAGAVLKRLEFLKDVDGARMERLVEMGLFELLPGQANFRESRSASSSRAASRAH